MKNFLSYIGFNHDLFHTCERRSKTDDKKRTHSLGVKSYRNRRLTRRLVLEELEDRRLLSVTWQVNTNSDVAENSWSTTDNIVSLREAIGCASTGDTINFASTLKGCEIILAGTQLNITQGITIDASNLWDAVNDKPGITINANQLSRVFYISDGNGSNFINVALKGLTITGGNVAGDGGGIYNQENLNITNCTITANKAVNNGNNGSFGGGILNNGNVTINNTLFFDNYSETYGGGISSGGNMSVTDSVFRDNLAGWGAGICKTWGSDKTVTCTNTIISDNEANYGGGIWSMEGPFNASNCIIANNLGNWEGGGFGLAGGTMTLSSCTIYGNTAVINGGGGYLCGGTVTMYNTIHTENSAREFGNDIFKSSASFVVQGYNNISSYTGWNGTSGNNYICDSTQPLFSNAANGDFRLATGSQAIDKGNNSYASGISTDMDGNLRIYNNRIDLGAYEFQDPSSPLIGYSPLDVSSLQSFLEQTDTDGVKNGTKLNVNYSSTDPTTWTGVTWEEFSGVKRVTKIGYSPSSCYPSWYDKKLCGMLDLSGCEKLIYLSCWKNNITSLNISTNIALTYLDCDNNKLTSLDVSNNTKLTYLDCGYNWKISSLDVSKNTALTGLDCEANDLTILDLSKNIALTELSCHSNNITSLDVSKNTKLTTLDVSKNTALKWLNCEGNNLTSLDLSKNTVLTYLDCWDNNLTSLDVSKNIALTELLCGKNNLTSLDVSQNTKLTTLDCWNSGLQTVRLPSYAINTTNICLYGSNTTWAFKNSSGTTVGTTTAASDSYYKVSELPLYVTNVAGTQTISFITTPITTALTGITLSSNAPSVGTAITTTITPTGATASYQWSYSSTATGTFTNISGATAASYTPTSTYVGKYLKCTATGTGNYSGTVSAVTAGVVQNSEPMIHATVVLRNSLSSSDISISLPGQVNTVQQGTTVYAEFWLQNLVAGGPEITGGSLGLNYNASVLNAVAIGHGNRFNSLATGSIENGAGLINDLGGATFSTDSLNGQWVRLGYVEFNTIAEGEITLALSAGGFNMSLESTGNVDWNKVKMSNAVLTVEKNCIYDIDDSGRIDFGDFSYFAATFRSKTGDANWNAKCDFNNDGRIDFGDFSYFVSAFGKNANDPAIIYPSAEASAVASETVSASAMPWASALADELPVLAEFSETTNTTEEKLVVQTCNIETPMVSERPETDSELPQIESMVISNETMNRDRWVQVVTSCSASSNESGISGESEKISYNNELLLIDSHDHGKTFNQLVYWNTRPILNLVVNDNTKQQGTALIGNSTLPLPIAVPDTVPMEEQGIWSEFANDIDPIFDDYDFVNDETIDQYGNEPSLFPELESEILTSL